MIDTILWILVAVGWFYLLGLLCVMMKDETTISDFEVTLLFDHPRFTMGAILAGVLAAVILLIRYV